MSEPVRGGTPAVLDPVELRDWVERQRWYASKSRHVTQVDLLEAATLGDEPPLLILALLQTGFATGTHELYQ
ncbi:MAG: maltokinase N-terminal cap-like domain-containing protein, partial [Pseudonocardiaceae bacterium]